MCNGSFQGHLRQESPFGKRQHTVRDISLPGGAERVKTGYNKDARDKLRRKSGTGQELLTNTYTRYRAVSHQVPRVTHR